MFAIRLDVALLESRERYEQAVRLLTLWSWESERLSELDARAVDRRAYQSRRKQSNSRIDSDLCEGSVY